MNDTIEDRAVKFLENYYANNAALLAGYSIGYRGLAEFAQAERADVREKAAKVCDRHSPKTGKIERGPLQDDEEYEAMVASIRDEQRGEQIAAEMIAKEIRNLD